nr:MAG TPA: hypothetical protein [Caudoviricetes sp.]
MRLIVRPSVVAPSVATTNHFEVFAIAYPLFGLIQRLPLF